MIHVSIKMDITCYANTKPSNPKSPQPLKLLKHNTFESRVGVLGIALLRGVLQNGTRVN